MRYLGTVVCLALLGCGDDGGTSETAPDANIVADAGQRDASAVPPNQARDAAVRDAASVEMDGAVDDASVAGDAGASDSGKTDAGGLAVGDCTGLLYCDDFEGAALDSAWQDKAGTVELDDTTAPNRGKKSLHVHTDNGGRSTVAHKKSFPVANERFWVRMFVNIKNLPTPDWSHWSLAWATPQGNPVEHRVGGQNMMDKKFYWGVGSDHGPTGDWTNIDTSSTVRFGVWQCLEMFIDSNADVSKVYRDGVEQPGLGTTLTVKHQGNASVQYEIPAIRQLNIGFFYYQGATPGQGYDLWIDSFALDDERIGCER